MSFFNPMGMVGAAGDDRFGGSHGNGALAALARRLYPDRFAPPGLPPQGYAPSNPPMQTGGDMQQMPGNFGLPMTGGVLPPDQLHPMMTGGPGQPLPQFRGVTGGPGQMAGGFPGMTGGGAPRSYAGNLSARLFEQEPHANPYGRGLYR